jgi:MoaA/NifB/PqqE/SkfB family radical SAM enzyme
MPVENPSKYINTIKNLTTVHWLITEKCNESCKFCYGIFRNNHISLKDAKKIVNFLKSIGITKIKFTGGEPLLYPYLKEVILYAKKLGIHTHIHTNGLLVDDKFIEFVTKHFDMNDDFSLSLDGSTEEIQTAVTRPKGHFSKNITILKKLKDKKFPISVKTLVCKINYNDIINLGRLLSDYKVDWVLFEFRPLERGKKNRKMFEISHKQYISVTNDITKNFSKNFKLIFIPKKVGHWPYIFIDALGEMFTIHPKFEKDIFVGNLLKEDTQKLLDKLKRIHGAK